MNAEEYVRYNDEQASETVTLRDKLARALGERDGALAKSDALAKELDRIKSERDSWNASFHAANTERIALTQENQGLREQMQEGNARYSELFGKLEATRIALRVARPLVHSVIVEYPSDDHGELAKIDAALNDKP